MNAHGASLLMNPHPCGHIVYPYTDEGLVGQAVALFASAGLRDQEGVILIMSADHCESIKLRLQLEGINSDAYERSGQLICLTAEDLLGQFLQEGVLDEDVFRSVIGGLIEQVRASVTNGHPGKVRIFGEMVSQLRGKSLTSTTRLEELWNEVIEKHSVALLCTYALSDSGDRLPEALIHLHSHSIERDPI
ncbi:MAG TPA: MEDS domain-containing protein [Bryobacteraceae bacterium]|nr:MEDS domain-containing protein [Bryobacteraceae bacterium]